MSGDMPAPADAVERNALRRVQYAVEQAMDCIRGETPEDCTETEARDDTLQKLREADRLLADLSAARDAVLEEAAQSGPSIEQLANEIELSGYPSDEVAAHMHRKAAEELASVISSMFATALRSMKGRT